MFRVGVGPFVCDNNALVGGEHLRYRLLKLILKASLSQAVGSATSLVGGYRGSVGPDEGLNRLIGDGDGSLLLKIVLSLAELLG